ncbi:hypothetical protein C0J45_0436 [Silurus meridionalis]|nr:hypothetical protein C0J45_0436 [Silurus meridionalis]
MSKESLFELINLSIDSLECGSVNFKALRSLLHGIVTHLFTETDAEDGSEEHAWREVEGPRPGRDKEAALEQSGAPELPGEQMEDSATELPRGQMEDSAPELPRGQIEESAPELPRGQVEESAAELPRGQVEESAPELPRGQVEESAAELPRGQVEESAAELPRGQVEESAAELPRGQVEESAAELPRGQVEESAAELPRGQVEVSAPELPRGQVEESATKVPVGQKGDRAKELPRGQVQDQKENVSELVTLEHVQATLDCQKESIMKELKDYVSKTQLLDTSTEFVIPGISEEAMPQPLSQDLTQFNTGVETQKILMIVYQMREKLDSLEARLRCLEGDITTPVYSQQQSDPNSKGVLMVVNQLREKLDSLGARVKQIEGDVRAPLSSQQQIDPSSQGALVDVNQLWEKLDSLEARVKHLEGDIGAPLPSQQQIDPSSQQSLVDVDQIWKKLDSLEALVKHLEGNIGAAMVSPQQTEPSSQRSLLDVNQLQEKLDSLEARMNHLEVQKLQKDMQNMYRELLTSIEKQKGSIEKEIPVEGTELTSDMQRVVLQLQARCDELHRTTTQLMKDHMQEKGHIKVDPLKKQLKIFQMNFQKALDVPKADDAAGFKKHLVVLPEFPNLPPSKIHKRLKKGTHFAKEPDTCALDKKVSEEYQDGMRSPINRLRASTGSIQKEKLWIPEESIP